MWYHGIEFNKTKTANGKSTQREAVQRAGGRCEAGADNVGEWARESRSERDRSRASVGGAGDSAVNWEPGIDAIAHDGYSSVPVSEVEPGVDRELLISNR